MHWRPYVRKCLYISPDQCQSDSGPAGLSFAPVASDQAAEDRGTTDILLHMQLISAMMASGTEVEAVYLYVGYCNLFPSLDVV